MVKRILLVVAIASMLVGCAVGDLAGGLRANARIQEHTQLVQQKRHAEALSLMRQEIASPGVSIGIYQASIRSLATEDLAQIALAEGKTGLLADPQADADALRWFNEALPLAGSDSSVRATVFSSYANYLALTGRAGSALPFRYLGLELIRGKDPVTALKLSRDLMETADRSGNKQLKIGLGLVFAEDMRKVGEREDLTFEKRMELLIGTVVHAVDTIAQDTPESVTSFWKGFIKLDEACASACPTTTVLPRLAFARAYARRGATAEARTFLEAARKGVAGEPAGSAMRKVQEVMSLGLEVQLLQAERKFAAVPAAYARFEAAMAAAGGEKSLGITSLDPNFEDDTKLALAEALAASGKPRDASVRYRELIGDLEGGRAAFHESQLTGFFTNPRARGAYEGLLRAELAAAGRNITRPGLARVINAAELFRARQLREMQARRAGRDRRAVVEATLAYLRAPQATASQLDAIPAGATLVYTIVLQDELVVIGATARRHEVRRLPVGRARLAAMVEEVAALLAAGADMKQLERDLLELSRLTLAPVASLIGSSGTLLVVPDGDLNRIPFSVLSLSPTSYRPVVDSHAVAVLPALEFLDAAPRGAAGGDFFGLGDPIYPNSEQAVGLSPAAMGQINPGYTRSGTTIFPALPETRTEVETIAASFRIDRSRVLLGREAVKSRFKAEPLERYRFVHLATHGVLGGDLPGLDEPALVLGVEPGGALLKASEIVSLRLNADLAVLSACQTGRGVYVEGEGVLGMGRAFLVAGSRAVVTSLWAVPSEPTEKLMIALYRRMQRGLPPQAALREAMLEIRAKHPKPQFWAPFVVMGGQIRG